MSSTPLGVTRYTTKARAKATAVNTVADTITVFLWVRSTQLPNGTPATAMNSMNAPPMMDVASTERVSR